MHSSYPQSPEILSTGREVKSYGKNQLSLILTKTMEQSNFLLKPSSKYFMSETLNTI